MIQPLEVVLGMLLGDGKTDTLIELRTADGV